LDSGLSAILQTFKLQNGFFLKLKIKNIIIIIIIIYSNFEFNAALAGRARKFIYLFIYFPKDVYWRVHVDCGQMIC
jgi:hypothetical protein